MVRFCRGRKVRTVLAAPMFVGALALPAAANAADARVTGSTIELVGFAGDSQILVTQQADPDTGDTLVRFKDQLGGGITPKSGCRTIVGDAVCRTRGPVLISLRLGAGNDLAIVGASLPVVFEGGDGNDTYTRAGGPVSRVDFRGGAGSDLAQYVAAPSGVAVVKDSLANDGRPGIDTDNVRADVEKVVGSQLGDTIIGSNEPRTPESFFGGDGDDTLRGGDGSDSFRGGPGADLMDGGPGGNDGVHYEDTSAPVNVTANVTNGNDGVQGEGDTVVGMENVYGSDFGDILSGSSPTGSFISGMKGADKITGTDERDYLFGNEGVDTILARGGDDYIQARDFESDTVFCGLGVDSGQFDSIDSADSACEQRPPVGKLKLKADNRIAANGTAQVRMSWKHPKAWKQLKSVTLRLSRGGAPVGEVTIDPRRSKPVASGSMRVASSKLTRKDKTVSAKLRLKLDPSIASQKLKLEVEAADVKGQRQIAKKTATLRP